MSDKDSRHRRCRGPGDQTIKIRATVPNKGRRPKPEMFARSTIAGPTMRSKIVIPGQVVLEQSGTQWIVVQNEHGRLEDRAIAVDSIAENRATIREGMTTGERIPLSPSSLSRVAEGDTATEGA